MPNNAVKDDAVVMRYDGYVMIAEREEYDELVEYATGLTPNERFVVLFGAEAVLRHNIASVEQIGELMTDGMHEEIRADVLISTVLREMMARNGEPVPMWQIA
jgi:hypothetical protein